ncbi:MAG: IclR family transcriptional regulator [Oceanospirillaceae bacterium]
MTDLKAVKGSSITRVLEIVEAVANAERPISPGDLALTLNIPKPSIHRLLQQLEAEGFVQTNLRGALIPGPRMQKIATGVLYSNHYRAERQAILTKLAEQIGETCGISVPDGTQMKYYDRAQTNWPLQIHLPIGSTTPVWCTASGKLYLSTLSSERRHRLCRNLALHKLTRNTLDDQHSLNSALLQIGDTGIGTDDQEFIEGMVACAVPILNQRGQLYACLFCHAPVIRKSLQDLLVFTPLLQQAATELAALVIEN